VTVVVPALAGAFLGAGFVAGYLAGGNAFPHPLGEEDERSFLQRLAQGDEAARNVLIERNLRLVAHIVKKFDNTGQDPEDLISIGTVGLIKGIGKFDPDKGTRLATFCARCIENEILMHLRTLKKLRGEISINDPIGTDREGNEMTFLDILSTEDDPIPDRVGTHLDAQLLRSRLAKLSRRERTILELRYGVDSGVKRTQREIARLLGISRSYVSRLEKKALSKLSREWSGG
jgi:RNA polymerase sporulation-specific sigma factor